MAESRPAEQPPEQTREQTPEQTAGRRILTVLSVLGIGGGLLAVLAASQPWASVDAAAAGMPASEVSVSGSAALPWLPALALVVAASWLGVLATSGLPRRAIGVLSLAAALAVLLGALTADGAVRDAVAAAVDASPTAAAGTAEALADQAGRTWWPLVTATGGLLGMLAAADLVRRGHRLPGLGRRHQSPVGAASEVSAASPGVPAEQVTADPADWWQALDDGRDPTR